jgi:hypothetical protein
MLMKSKMPDGRKEQMGNSKTAQPCFPNSGDKSLTSMHKEGGDDHRTKPASTPKTLGGRSA